jgi:hypothetical protein
MREDGIRRALVALKEDTRNELEDMAAVERLRENVAGHLLNAPNMVGRLDAKVRRRCRIGAAWSTSIVRVVRYSEGRTERRRVYRKGAWMKERQQIVVVAQESLRTTRDFFEDVPGPVALALGSVVASPLSADNTPISFSPIFINTIWSLQHILSCAYYVLRSYRLMWALILPAFLRPQRLCNPLLHPTRYTLHAVHRRV